MSRQTSITQKSGTVLLYVVLTIVGIVILVPIIFLFVNSFKTTAAIFASPWNLPKDFRISNYSNAWIEGGIGGYFLNSIVVTAFTLAIGIILSSMAAYGIQRMKWKLSGAVKMFLLIGLMIPVNATLIPLYIIFSKMHLSNTYVGLVAIYIAFQLPVTIIILSAFLSTIPRAMEEAAVIDGSSLFRAFAQIILPMARPALLTVLIFNFVGTWNELLVALVFISNQIRYTLPVGLTNFAGEYSTQWGPLLAGIFLAMLPAIVIYSIFNARIVSGITAGAIKI